MLRRMGMPQDEAPRSGPPALQEHLLKHLLEHSSAHARMRSLAVGFAGS